MLISLERFAELWVKCFQPSLQPEPGPQDSRGRKSTDSHRVSSTLHTHTSKCHWKHLTYVQHWVSDFVFPLGLSSECSTLMTCPVGGPQDCSSLKLRHCPGNHSWDGTVSASQRAAVCEHRTTLCSLAIINPLLAEKSAGECMLQGALRCWHFPYKCTHRTMSLLSVK